MQAQKITNPKTGRPILVNGPTYQKLLKQGYNLKSKPKHLGKKPQKRFSDSTSNNLSKTINMKVGAINKTGNRTRGWGEVAPKRGRPRNLLYDKCGDRCFLKPDTLSFPICPSDRCEIDCRGVESAYIRAAQWKYHTIKQNADRLRQQKCPR